MAYLHFWFRCNCVWLSVKYTNLTSHSMLLIQRREIFLLVNGEKLKSKFLLVPNEKTTNICQRNVTIISKSKPCENKFKFDSNTISQLSVSNEIQFFRDVRNNYTEAKYSDDEEPYGPPLAILLPWKTLSETLLTKLIEIYGEKGFDVVCVCLKPEQYLYPCVSGSAMNVVSDLLNYLNDCHRNRPYVIHGFSIGVYMYGEMLAQFSDQFDTHRCIMNNIRGCLWDSPVDIFAVKSCIGKYFYPQNWFQRFDP